MGQVLALDNKFKKELVGENASDRAKHEKNYEDSLKNYKLNSIDFASPHPTIPGYKIVFIEGFHIVECGHNCGICTFTHGDGDHLIRFPCGHLHHEKCLERDFLRKHQWKCNWCQKVHKKLVSEELTKDMVARPYPRR